MEPSAELIHAIKASPEISSQHANWLETAFNEFAKLHTVAEVEEFDSLLTLLVTSTLTVLERDETIETLEDRIDELVRAS